jgi:hypothetical protein
MPGFFYFTMPKIIIWVHNQKNGKSVVAVKTQLGFYNAILFAVYLPAMASAQDMFFVR